MTEPDQQHHSRSILEEKSPVRLPELNELYVERPKNELNENGELRGCCETEQRSPDDNSFAELIDQLPQIDKTMRNEVSEKPGENNTIPLIPAYCNFQAARKMAQENLEHQPLPDSIMDRTFLKMQSQGLLNPELSLNVEPQATGLYFHFPDTFFTLKQLNRKKKKFNKTIHFQVLAFALTMLVQRIARNWRSIVQKRVALFHRQSMAAVVTRAPKRPSFTRIR